MYSSSFRLDGCEVDIERILALGGGLVGFTSEGRVEGGRVSHDSLRG